MFFFIYRIISSSELQFFASRHAAAIAAVAAAALPPPPSSATNPNGVGLSSSASGLNAPPPVPPTHQHDFHPAYRIPGYMEHLYSLQHASAASSSSLHGKYTIQRLKNPLIQVFSSLFLNSALFQFSLWNRKKPKTKEECKCEYEISATNNNLIQVHPERNQDDKMMRGDDISAKKLGIEKNSIQYCRTVIDSLKITMHQLLFCSSP